VLAAVDPREEAESAGRHEHTLGNRIPQEVH
jgi:hypothetical protein